MNEAKVIELPTELHKLRSSDRLLRRYIEICQIKDKAARVAAMFEWQIDLQDHADAYAYGVSHDGVNGRCGNGKVN